MTTVTVVKKNGRIAIAADTLTKWGGGKESADYVANHEKIIRIGDSLVAITGSATFKLILEDYFANLESPPVLDSTVEIFRVWNQLHPAPSKSTTTCRPERTRKKTSNPPAWTC